ncbi:MAG: hypothetical protein H8E66_06145 [Planctomycetes bacterium]|nr:hypothetical protein [Planctomycetota bacterium]
MFACNTFLNSWALIAAAIGLGERIQVQKAVNISQHVSIRASEEEVLTTLGEPLFQWEAQKGFLFFGSHPAQSIYGTTIDAASIVIPYLPFPNPLPLKIRLFSADTDDLVIDWTQDRRVAHVARPELTIPEGAEDYFEPIFWISEVTSLFFKS